MKVVKGMIIIPEFYLTRHTDNYKVLLRKISKEFKWPIAYTDHPDIPSDTEIVIVFAVPQRNRPEVLKDLYKLNKKIKLIGYTQDIYPGNVYFDNDKEYKKQLFRMFDRFDIILSAVDEKFREWYPEYVNKMVFFPQFFAPHKRYSVLEFNKRPKMKCLLSGNLDPNIYPLRGYLSKQRIVSRIECRGSKYRIGDSYARLLHSYFCCVATSSIYNIVVKKYFEILATGSLLLANQVKDFDSLGFIPYKHYIPITMDRGTSEYAVAQIRRCLYFPEKYEQIRKDGAKLARTFYGVRTRFEQLKKILEGVI